MSKGEPHVAGQGDREYLSEIDLPKESDERLEKFVRGGCRGAVRVWCLEVVV